ncbi:reverse transcriptase, partial [Phytophthora megakarya]
MRTSPARVRRPLTITLDPRRTTQTRWGPRITVSVPMGDRRPGTRWGPPRTAGASGQLPASASGATGQLPEPMEVTDTVDEQPQPWTLRFDGACRRNPGPGGAGAALFDPSGAVVWTCSHHLPSSSETNNTAEYTALLLGVQSALHHGATRLWIEGDSNLVIAQVRGTFGCTNRRLRRLRNSVRHGLQALEHYKLHHIDRQANAHADRLANRALDQRRTRVECGLHDQGLTACFRPDTALTASAATPAPRYTAGDNSTDEGDPHQSEDADVAAEIAARDGGEAFPVIPIGPNSAPARQPRLRLRQLSDEDHDAAATALQTLVDTMASRIADATDWAAGEGYIGAIPARIREALQPFAPAPRPYPSTPPTSSPQQRRRPPRVTRDQREHRLDEALDDMEATQRQTPRNQRSIRKAKRRVGRVRASIARLELRRAFARDESKCVAGILLRASAEAA